MRAVLLALVLLAPAALAGAAEYDSDEAGPDRTGWNTQRKMARSADGSLWYAFVEPAEDGKAVVVARRAPDGSQTRLPPPRAARGDASRPSVAIDAAGALHVAWTERADEDREVFAARWDGSAWVGATQLSGGLGYAGFPSLAADARGLVHAAWYGFDGSNYQVFYRVFEAGAWAPARQLSSGTLDANNPSIVVDRDGGAHVAWYKSDGRRYHIWYAYRAPSGEWDLPRRLSSGEGEAYNAALAVDRGGVVHAAWDERRDGGFVIVHAARRAGEWSAPAVVANASVGGEYPAIAAWGDGVLVAWSRVDGSLWATTLEGAPQRLLGGAEGRNPSLRGPAWGGPEPDRRAGLDLLFAERAGDAWDVRVVELREDCSPFAAPGACESPKPVPAPGWPLVVAALALAASTLRRRAFWIRPRNGPPLAARSPRAHQAPAPHAPLSARVRSGVRARVRARARRARRRRRGVLAWRRARAQRAHRHLARHEGPRRLLPPRRQGPRPRRARACGLRAAGRVRRVARQGVAGRGVR